THGVACHRGRARERETVEVGFWPSALGHACRRRAIGKKSFFERNRRQKRLNASTFSKKNAARSQACRSSPRIKSECRLRLASVAAAIGTATRGMAGKRRCGSSGPHTPCDIVHCNADTRTILVDR